MKIQKNKQKIQFLTNMNAEQKQQKELKKQIRDNQKWLTCFD